MRKSTGSVLFSNKVHQLVATPHLSTATPKPVDNNIGSVDGLLKTPIREDHVSPDAIQMELDNTDHVALAQTDAKNDNESLALGDSPRNSLSGLESTSFKETTVQLSVPSTRKKNLSMIPIPVSAYSSPINRNQPVAENPPALTDLIEKESPTKPLVSENTLVNLDVASSALDSMTPAEPEQDYLTIEIPNELEVSQTFPLGKDDGALSIESSRESNDSETLNSKMAKNHVENVQGLVEIKPLLQEDAFSQVDLEEPVNVAQDSNSSPESKLFDANNIEDFAQPSNEICTQESVMEAVIPAVVEESPISLKAMGSNELTNGSIDDNSAHLTRTKSSYDLTQLCSQITLFTDPSLSNANHESPTPNVIPKENEMGFDIEQGKVMDAAFECITVVEVNPISFLQKSDSQATISIDPITNDLIDFENNIILKQNTQETESREIIIDLDSSDPVSQLNSCIDALEDNGSLLDLSHICKILIVVFEHENLAQVTDLCMVCLDKVLANCPLLNIAEVVFDTFSNDEMYNFGSKLLLNILEKDNNLPQPTERKLCQYLSKGIISRQSTVRRSAFEISYFLVQNKSLEWENNFYAEIREFAGVLKENMMRNMVSQRRLMH